MLKVKSNDSVSRACGELMQRKRSDRNLRVAEETQTNKERAPEGDRQTSYTHV
jgi:hypothetical protein